MAYEKQNFKDGNVLTAAQLNRMEDGIANAGGIPIYKESELTRELMFELAKNRTVHFVQHDSYDYRVNTTLITSFSAYKERENCGEMLPAEISAGAPYNYDGWTIPDVTDEDVQEIRDIWEAMEK